MIVPDWPAPASVIAGTITRLAGADTCTALPPGVRLQQVHGTDIVDAALAEDAVAADACYARKPLTTCSILTADCIPVLLCNRRGDEVAAIHAGWRGLVAGVIERSLAQLRSAPGELLVWLGPAISQANYEVGAALREEFLLAAPAVSRQRTEACFLRSGDRYRADLLGLARLRLEFAGVKQVYGGGHCTFAEPELFDSYRRDGSAAGRIRSFIYFTAA